MSEKLPVFETFDPTLPLVEIKIGGRVRLLAYDFEAIMRVEKLTGVNLLEACDFAGLSFTQVRAMFYASLLHHDPELTIETLNDWPIAHNLITIQAAIALAWNGSITKAKDTPGKAQRPARRKRA